MMLCGLTLREARVEAPGGQGWLLAEVPQADAEGCRREQAALLFVRLNPGKAACGQDKGT